MTNKEFREKMIESVNKNDINRLTELCQLANEKKYSFTLDDICNEVGEPLLMIAIKKQFEPIVKFLIEQGASVNIKNESNLTPLHYAASRENVDLVLLLLTKGADIYAKDVQGKLPLHHAASSSCAQSVKIFEILISKYRKPLSYTTHNLETIYHLIPLSSQRHEKLSLLISDLKTTLYLLKSKNKRGQTPLHLFALFASEKTLQLLDNFITPNVIDMKDNEGNTAFLNACKKANLSSMKYLANKWADVTVTNNSNVNALLTAAGAININKNFLQYLIEEQKLSLTAVDDKGNSCLHLLCANGKIEEISYLLSKGANINAIDNNQHSTLHLAIATNQLDIVKLLLNNHASLNQADKLGATALDMAQYYKTDPEIENLLKQKGAINGSGNVLVKSVKSAREFDKVLNTYLANHSNQKNINIYEILLNAGYAPILENIEINLKNNKFHTIDFTNVSLKNSNLYNVACTNLICADTNLEKMKFGNVNFSHINFENSNLKEADLRGLNISHTNTINFNHANLENTLTYHLKSLSAEQKNAAIYLDINPISHFRQNLLVTKFKDKLDSKGICQGLVVDYARHVLTNLAKEKNANYLNKLTKKLMVNSENFISRIKSYQSYLQHIKGEAVSHNKLEKFIADKDLDKYLSNTLKTAEIIGISFHSTKGAHIIAIHVIRNPLDNSITGYKIFDPNFSNIDSEIDFTKGTPVENKTAFNKQLTDFVKFYNRLYGGLLGFEMIDLGLAVKNYGLSMLDKNSYKKTHKKLDATLIREAALAIEQSKADKLKNLIEGGLNINCKINEICENKSPTFLNLAIENNNLEAANILIDSGAILNQTYSNPLIQAVNLGNKRFIELLVQKGADINIQIQDEAYPSPLNMAIVNAMATHNTEIIKCLLKLGADPEKEIKFLNKYKFTDIEDLIKHLDVKKIPPTSVKFTQKSIFSDNNQRNSSEEEKSDKQNLKPVK